MRVTAAMALLILFACATAPKHREIQRSATFPGQSFDEVWSAVIESFGELNLAISNIEKDSGLITTDWMRVPLSYLDCGGSGLATDSNHRGRFNVFVKDQAEGPTMSVNASFTATRTFDTSSGQPDCVSTGELERDLHSMVASKTGSAAVGSP